MKVTGSTLVETISMTWVGDHSCHPTRPLHPITPQCSVRSPSPQNMVMTTIREMSECRNPAGQHKVGLDRSHTCKSRQDIKSPIKYQPTSRHKLALHIEKCFIQYHAIVACFLQTIFDIMACSYHFSLQ